MGGSRPSGRSDGSSHRFGQRSGAGAVHLPADYHRLVFADLYTRSPGRKTLSTAGVYQDLRHVFRGVPLDHPGAGLDGSADSRAHSTGSQQPGEPAADRLVRARRPNRAPISKNYHSAGYCGVGSYRSRFRPARLRIHAAAERGNDFLHADYPARNFRNSSVKAIADAGPPAQNLSRGRVGFRQSRPRRNIHRPGALQHGRNDSHVEAGIRVATWNDLGKTCR